MKTLYLENYSSTSRENLEFACFWFTVQGLLLTDVPTSSDGAPKRIAFLGYVENSEGILPPFYDWNVVICSQNCNIERVAEQFPELAVKPLREVVEHANAYITDAFEMAETENALNQPCRFSRDALTMLVRLYCEKGFPDSFPVFCVRLLREALIPPGAAGAFWVAGETLNVGYTLETL